MFVMGKRCDHVTVTAPVMLESSSSRYPRTPTARLPGVSASEGAGWTSEVQGEGGTGWTSEVQGGPVRYSEVQGGPVRYRADQ